MFCPVKLLWQNFYKSCNHIKMMLWLSTLKWTWFVEKIGRTFLNRRLLFIFTIPEGIFMVSLAGVHHALYINFGLVFLYYRYSIPSLQAFQWCCSESCCLLQLQEEKSELTFMSKSPPRRCSFKRLESIPSLLSWEWSYCKNLCCFEIQCRITRTKWNINSVGHESHSGCCTTTTWSVWCKPWINGFQQRWAHWSVKILRAALCCQSAFVWRIYF